MLQSTAWLNVIIGLILAYTARDYSNSFVYEDVAMSVAKVTEIIASSNKSFDDAVEQGVKRADKTLKNVKSVWVKEQKAMVDNGKVTEYRVTMKVSFILKD